MLMTFRDAAVLYYSEEEVEARAKALLDKVHELARVEAEQAPAEERARRLREQELLDAYEASPEWDAENAYAVEHAAVERLEALSDCDTKLKWVSNHGNDCFRIEAAPEAEDLLKGQRCIHLPFGARGWYLRVKKWTRAGSYRIDFITDRYTSPALGCYAETVKS